MSSNPDMNSGALCYGDTAYAEELEAARVVQESIESEQILFQMQQCEDEKATTILQRVRQKFTGTKVPESVDNLVMRGARTNEFKQRGYAFFELMELSQQYNTVAALLGAGYSLRELFDLGARYPSLITHGLAQVAMTPVQIQILFEIYRVRDVTRLFEDGVLPNVMRLARMHFDAKVLRQNLAIESLAEFQLPLETWINVFGLTGNHLARIGFSLKKEHNKKFGWDIGPVRALLQPNDNDGGGRRQQSRAKHRNGPDHWGNNSTMIYRGRGTTATNRGSRTPNNAYHGSGVQHT